MSTPDRELLEAAARAAGIELTTPDGKTNGFWVDWSPLTDDGDAFRLAVKLNIATVFESEPDGATVTCCVEWCATKDCSELLGKDPYAATRRAIVRAAASLAPATPTMGEAP